ncbi:MmgE/PrpD family protein [Pseudomonas palleroniana]|uniref:MmgE/PrpD family protein n=1 Tax=Pseudomonas palleroniana TaxID=191390 RepID=A0A2L1J5N5_9PSED|nr:MmgE/PrpD family protein [Pseudomonas palleroniana]AVE03804.1 MmgE/PrpD family protein [Pseudomonas palleroniana]
MPAESVTRQIARTALNLRYDDLPASVIHKAIQLIADTLIVAAAGRSQASSMAMGRAMAPSSGQSHVWFSDRQQGCSAVDATFINALHAGALDYDSLNGSVHADLVTLPAAWAIAEQLERSPRLLITAYVTASEVVSRLSRCSQGPSKGWSGTSIYGGIGAALVSGLLMGLDVERLTHALGIAVTQAAGTQQANVEQTLAKRLQPAFAARNGVFAALLAEAGASGPAQALEGKFGLRALYQSGDDSSLLNGWGSEWQMLDTAVKRFPVCACSHAAIQALLDVKAQTGFTVDQVAEVVAVISPFMNRLVGGDFDLHGDLEVVAQFNLRYHLASVLLRGPITLRDLQASQLQDDQVLALLPKIRLLIHTDNPHELAPARITVTLSDGRVFDHVCEALPGSPQSPLTAAQWAGKARECADVAGPALAPARLPGFLRALDSLPELPTLAEIWSET